MKMHKLEDNSTKPELVIFDFDGCIANSDDFVLTNKQAWEKDPDVFLRAGVGQRGGQPSKATENDFSLAYLYDHHEEIEPYYGILDQFVKLSITSNVAIITARFDVLRAKTVDWLKETILKRYGDSTWRRVNYKMFFNDFKEKSLSYKKNTITKLLETYNIQLMIEDHPEVANWAKSKGINVLVPVTGYKNLNGNDLIEPQQEDANKPIKELIVEKDKIKLKPGRPRKQ